MAGLRPRPAGASHLPPASRPPESGHAGPGRCSHQVMAGRSQEDLAMEKIVWLMLGSTTFAAALFAAKSMRALRIGRRALGGLMIGGGALVNAIYLASGTSFSSF